ncbi:MULTISPECIES: 3-deoxy-D-manno-octulosonic acid kinase [Glaesserella]|uniref:3-deoxy-D-manno-octulosonic acid kinase n=1 Tax=Glaesserella australis TaxID=2094024 RepID=A0A328BZD8_9PAST|nr:MULTISPECIES: 3-deoxy-D-manno-octulosonic acid kinase [Glaesserella]AUI66060.1 3-deoxy-D-manno-octulosonic acid kinase [Glaesserella sp. 15-184]RAL18220.1 3-deoxy-D-manno-octulosonic acid kinase [Glaesserella australis]
MYYHFNEKIVSSVQQAFVKQILNCKDFSQSDRLLGSSKGRGTTWFLKTEQELGVNSVLRHYYRGGLFGKVIKDHYFFQGNKNTRAMLEFRLLEQLSQWHLPVPRPIAIKIQRNLCFYQADILLEKIANTQDLSQILQNQPLSSEQYQHIGKLIRQLHDHQVHHSDLNIHNILLDKQGKFWLIDFDKCQIQQNDEWKQGNLDRLLRSFNKETERLNIQFQQNDWDMLLKGYHSI